MITLHTNGLETLWVLTAILTLGLGIYSLRDAIIDAAFLVASGVNGPRKLIADMNIRQEGARMVVGAIMLICSVSSLFLPPPPPAYADLPQSLIGVVGSITICLVLILSSALDRSSRHRLARYASQTVAKDPTSGATVDKHAGIAESSAGTTVRPQDGTQGAPTDRRA